ncbi:MAG: CRISPR-associated endonuclease/helicase Cas3 [Archaeoglobaceae archaeon]|nr:CRISPR-associated endonuclease/helicase Cas3 [Archaeoglobaceae archaeon]
MLLERLDEVSKKWFKGKPRPFVEHAINEIERNWDSKNFFVVEAPTGYGKSTISATIALNSLVNDFKCIVAFPLRTLIEDQFAKFEKLLDSKATKEILGKRYMHNPDSPYLIKPITLTTVDTLALNIFGIPPETIEKVAEERSLGHYFFSWASVLLSNLVLDEVHLLADSTKSLSFLASLMKISRDFEQRAVFMSATLPDALKKRLEEVGREKIEFVEFDERHDPDFCSERMSKKYEIRVEDCKDDKYGKIMGWIKSSEFSRVLIVFNTVADAIEFYRENLDDLKNVSKNTLLIHSRFTERDRERKIEEIRKLQKERDFVIVSTQVIEAGVDLSSDLMITEISPANSMIQRFGRFLRFFDEKEGRIHVWFEEDFNSEYYTVYDAELTKKTLTWLHDNPKMNVHLPIGDNGFSAMINSVYRPEDFEFDLRIIESFERIFLNLETAPKKALGLLFKMGGSFVREGLQIPVSFLKREEISEVSTSEFSRNFVVSMAYETFLKIIPSLSGAVSERMQFMGKEELKFLHRNTEAEKLLEFMLRKRVIAFLVDASYSSEFGLVVK